MNRNLRIPIALLGCLACALAAHGQAGSAARAAGYRYLSPSPGSPHTPVPTRYFLVRFEDVLPSEVENLATTFITVTGERSGEHTGEVRVASDGRTVIFDAPRWFYTDERGTVTLDPLLAPGTTGTLQPFTYEFMVTGPMTDPVGEPAGATAGPAAEPPLIPTGSEARAASIKPNGVSVPGDFPDIVITVNENPSPGGLFLQNMSWTGDEYMMILDNNGWPLWYERYQRERCDFKVQGNGTITWREVSGHYGTDENFGNRRRYLTVNGYQNDGHEFTMFPDGAYMKLGYWWETVDMTHYLPGAHPAARVRESSVQLFTAAGDPVLQWRAWDNFDPGDLDPRLNGSDPYAGSFDLTHMNALEVDFDGNILVSSRHLSEITKIDRDTGEIIWRLGGVHSDFAFVDDPLGGFNAQHAINYLGNSRYLLFDNGFVHDPPVSRAVEYELDPEAGTATLVWQYRDTPDKYTYRMGNAQRLPSGNTLINFVQYAYPKVIEVDPEGVKQFEMYLYPEFPLYRAFRFPWNGVVAAPYLVVEPYSDHVALIFNKFGDDDVDHYRIYAGTSPEPTNLVAASATTLAKLSCLENGREYFFRVTAVSGAGVESAFSNEESLVVRLARPGRNMVVNGDFAAGTVDWTMDVIPPADAEWRVEDGAVVIDVTSGGVYISDVQLAQAGQVLVEGGRYELAFDAWAATPRIFEVQVGRNETPIGDYAGIQPFTVTPVLQPYVFTFTMEDPSDYDAVLAFHAGAHPADVRIDNVSLRWTDFAAGDLNEDGAVDLLDLEIMAGEWMDAGGTSIADLNGDGRVDAADFSILGGNWTPRSCSP